MKKKLISTYNENHVMLFDKIIKLNKINLHGLDARLSFRRVCHKIISSKTKIVVTKTLDGTASILKSNDSIFISYFTRILNTN